jgi:hypothetical protein
MSLTFLSQQSFGYRPRAKRSRSNTRAGLVGYLFETAHKAMAPMWQAGTYIRSCELSSVVERAHSDVARKTKGWLVHEIRHPAEKERGLNAERLPNIRPAPPPPRVGQGRSHLAEPGGHSATGTLELFQQRREMERNGMVDDIVLGPQPSPDFPQPRASTQDVARSGSARSTRPAPVMTDSCRLRRALTCGRRLGTSRPFLLRTSVKLQGISRHVGLVFTIFFGD